jgi:hypothetical protein
MYSSPKLKATLNLHFIVVITLTHPTESRWRRSAPHESSWRTQSRFPPRAAKCSGVLPGNLKQARARVKYMPQLSSKDANFLSHKNAFSPTGRERERNPHPHAPLDADTMAPFSSKT